MKIVVCIHYLLPASKDSFIANEQRRRPKFNSLIVRTSRYMNSFVTYICMDLLIIRRPSDLSALHATILRQIIAIKECLIHCAWIDNKVQLPASPWSSGAREQYTNGNWNSNSWRDEEQTIQRHGNRAPRDCPVNCRCGTGVGICFQSVLVTAKDSPG